MCLLLLCDSSCFLDFTKAPAAIGPKFAGHQRKLGKIQLKPCLFRTLHSPYACGAPALLALKATSFAHRSRPHPARYSDSGVTFHAASGGTHISSVFSVQQAYLCQPPQQAQYNSVWPFCLVGNSRPPQVMSYSSCVLVLAFIFASTPTISETFCYPGPRTLWPGLGTLQF